MSSYQTLYRQSTGMPLGPPTQGKELFVRPYDGADGNSGRGTSKHKALKTMSRAIALATANQNDTIYLLSQSNTGSATTDYITANLAFNKDGIRVIGVASGAQLNSRARIAVASTATAFTPMVTFSCNNSYFENLSFYNGLASATQDVCAYFTGDHNTFVNCHFLGTMTDTQDVATACDAKFYTASENTFIGCTFGMDTVKRGTAQVYGMWFYGTSGNENARNTFIDCTWLSWAEAAGYTFIRTSDYGLDRATIFKNCMFVNHPTGFHTSSTTLTECFDISSTGNGMFIMDAGCGFVGAPCWEADTESAKLYCLGTTPTAAAGVGILAESP